MTRTWQALYSNGSSAAAHSADVKLLSGEIEVTTSNATHRWLFSNTTLTQGFYKNEPVRLEHGEEAVVVTDRSIVEYLKRSNSRIKNINGPLRGFRLAIWLPLLLCLSFGFISLLYFELIPSGTGLVADLIPPSLEERLGETTEKSFLADLELYQNPEITKNVEIILTRLKEAVGETPYDFKLKIIDAPLKNAYALPGGRILLFRGIIEETKSAEELAGVMAHEMVHVLKRHATKGILQQLSTYMLFSFITGDSSSLTSIAQNIGTLRYSREAENEADRLAARLLIASGIDPRGLASFFKSTSKPEHKMPAAFKYLSTHPNSDRRAEAIDAQIVKYSAGYSKESRYTPLLAKVDWHKLTSSAATTPQDKTASRPSTDTQSEASSTDGYTAPLNTDKYGR